MIPKLIFFTFILVAWQGDWADRCYFNETAFAKVENLEAKYCSNYCKMVPGCTHYEITIDDNEVRL
jgi:hypothetical protein